MRKILFLCLLMCGALESHALELNGKYVSQSGELLFRFTADSLYIDIAQSQRNISSLSGARNICSSISARTRTATTTPTRDITSSR